MPIRRPARPGSKKELPAALARAASAHTDKRIALYFQDEARFSQKGRSCRHWWLRGQRPTGPVDQRYAFAYVFAAVEPATGRDFCLVLPAVSTAAMSAFLRHFAAALPEDEHALMVLDGAGWHTSHELVVPSNVTLLRLPPYSPELSPIERLWLYLRERHLSHRVHEEYLAIVDAISKAWCQLTPDAYARSADTPGSHKSSDRLEGITAFAGARRAFGRAVQWLARHRRTLPSSPPG